MHGIFEAVKVGPTCGALWQSTKQQQIDWKTAVLSDVIGVMQ